MGYLIELMQSAPPAFSWLMSLLALLATAFTIWMLIDCLRNGREYYWCCIILMTGGLGALVYFFLYKWEGSSLENLLFKQRNLRQRVRELEAKIHHLDKADHYADLADIYRKEAKWDEARELYEEALERDSELFDARVHLGYVLLAQGDAKKAWGCFEPALKTKPDFDHGELSWQAARCQVALCNLTIARKLYEQLLAAHTYAEAHLEYAELLEKTGNQKASIEALQRLVADAAHAPRFQQRRERRWTKQAENMLKAKGARC